jgi:hypothetical protein
MVVFPVPCTKGKSVSNAGTKMKGPNLAPEDHIVMAGLDSMDNTIEDVLLLPPQMLCPGTMPNVDFAIRQVLVFDRIIRMHD